MKKITLRMLKAMEACYPKRRKFKKIFGDEARVTLKNVRIAMDESVGLSWLQSALWFHDSVTAAQRRELHRTLATISHKRNSELFKAWETYLGSELRAFDTKKYDKEVLRVCARCKELEVRAYYNLLRRAREVEE